jgi:hypothetical protein
VPREKIKRYALSVDHPTSRHKVRVFACALGIHDVDWQTSRTSARVRPRALGGLSCEIESLVDGLNGRSHPVVSIWFVSSDPADGRLPRLVTRDLAIP